MITATITHDVITGPLKLPLAIPITEAAHLSLEMGKICMVSVLSWDFDTGEVSVMLVPHRGIIEVIPVPAETVEAEKRTNERSCAST